MKKIRILLALLSLLCVQAVLAASGVVTYVAGSVQARSGTAPARVLRVGDEVVQGDTISTAAASNVVLKFDDGHVTTLSANSRMTITAYEYNATQRTGNMLLSLLNGGMRAITGLLGHNHPSSVRYRAGIATVGIRGTDTSLVYEGDIVAVTVGDGSITFTYAGQTITVSTGEGAIGADGRITSAAAAAIFNRLPPALQQAFGDLQAMTDAINRALPGVPRENGPNAGNGTPNPALPPGGAGGGNASSH